MGNEKYIFYKNVECNGLWGKPNKSQLAAQKSSFHPKMIML